MKILNAYYKNTCCKNHCFEVFEIFTDVLLFTFFPLVLLSFKSYEPTFYFFFKKLFILNLAT